MGKEWSFSPEDRKPGRVSALAIPVHHGTEGLSQHSKQEGKKALRIEESETKFPSFTDNMIGYIENFQESMENLLQLTN